MGMPGDHSRTENDSSACQLEHASGVEEFQGCCGMISFVHYEYVLLSLANKELVAYSEAGFSGREDGGRRKVEL